MTVEELRAEAEKLGYYITKKRKTDNLGKYHKCGECIHLDLNEKCTIGYKCTHPCKRFRSSTAQWKYNHTPACKLFIER